MASPENAPAPKVALLTAGRDRPYAFGMAAALMAKGLCLDIIGGDDLDCPEWHGAPNVRFFNFRGDLSEQASLPRKVTRVLDYYARLLRYALTSQADVFHVLWNNKFETFDRVPLMLYYKLLGKKTVLTVHNVNMGERDDNDSWFNRLTLRCQYGLVDHLFVHTQKMKQALVDGYNVPEKKITVIPFGINNATPNTNLTTEQARKKLGVAATDRGILFFGNIAPYKGLEFLLEAFRIIMTKGDSYRLLVAGRPKSHDTYWHAICESLDRHPYRERIIARLEFIPDADTEMYFKAADVVVLPYRHIFQSGVLSLGYSFGLPVIASDVGALREDIVEGQTGFMCKPDNAEDLAGAIQVYFDSDLYKRLSDCREAIQQYAIRRYSWSVVGDMTVNVYETLYESRRMIDYKTT